MTAPLPHVDIAAAVERARAYVANYDDNGVKNTGETMQTARALLALADERATVEQRTAERIAAWLEENRERFGWKWTGRVKPMWIRDLLRGAWKEHP